MSLITWYAESAESPFTAEPCRQERRTSRMTDVWMPAAVSCWHRAVRRTITMSGIITLIPFGGAQVLRIPHRPTMGHLWGKADPDVAWHPTYIGEGDAKCPSHFVYETAVRQSFMEMLYAIKRDHEENGENAWIDSEFRTVYQKVQEHVAERDSSRKAELDEQILQLEKKWLRCRAG